MKLSDRRLAKRFNHVTALHIRAWNSQTPEQTCKSINLSECGVYFETDTPPRQGTMIQLRLEMPEEVTGQPKDEWRCAGTVVRVQAPNSQSPLIGVSVRFDFYEVARNTSSEMAPALLSDL